MLQNLAPEIINCYERARQARNLAGHAVNDRFKGDFVSAEKRWMGLAHSYEWQHQLTRTAVKLSRRKKTRVVVLMMQAHGAAFEPEVVMLMDTAYHASLNQLGLICEVGMTLMIARRLIDLAAKGERDPKRMVAATVDF